MCGNAMSALYHPIKDGDADGLTQILSRFGDYVPLIMKKQFAANEGQIAICDIDPIFATPMNFAVMCDEPSCLDVLIEFGGDVNERGKGGSTILHRAIKRCSVQCVRILLQNGADPHNSDEWGIYPIHVCCGAYGPSEGRLAILELLLEYGHSSDIEVKDEYGKTAMHYAAQYGNTDVIQKLLDLGVDINIKDKTLRSPYQHAERQPRAQKFLVSKGAEVPIPPPKRPLAAPQSIQNRVGQVQVQ